MAAYKTGLGIQDSLDLFINHYRYGDDYESSTVLVDPILNVMAYFDRGTSDITCIQCDTIFDNLLIIANDKKVDITEKIMYIPMDYHKAISPYSTEISRLKKNKTKNKKRIEEIILQANTDVFNYNTNYFKNLENRIDEQKLLRDDSSSKEDGEDT